MDMKNRLGNFITQRDRDTLLMIYNYDSCGYAHVRRKLFSDVKESVFWTRMTKLRKAGYIKATRMPALTGIGCGKDLLDLDSKGRQVIAEEWDCPLKSLRRPRKISRAIPADHQHGICDFRVALELACMASHFGGEMTRIATLIQWINERELRGKIDRTPDGMFTLEVNGTYQVFRLELDRSTIDDSKRMVERLAAYLKGEDRSPVLWVVPDEKRAAKLSEWALTAANGGDATMFWITTAGQDPLGPVWQVVGGPMNARLTP